MGSSVHVSPRQASAFPLVSFDTRDVSVNDRIDYWEHRCAERVVGLRCTSMSENGLEARFEYSEFGAIKMIDITGNQHVIERSPSLLRRFEKDSVFVSFLRKGSAFVNRAQACTVVGEGDVVIYDTNRPYMHGFPAHMRHVIYEIPGADFRERFPHWQLDEAVRFDARFNPTRLVSQALRKVVEADLTRLETHPQRLAHEDRLWKVLCDYGMVITFHLGGRVPRFGEKQYFLPDMPMSKLAMAEPIGIFIHNGIFERFPDLRIGSMESGIGWFAWFAEYNDRTWEKQRYWTDSVIDKPPSYYMDQNVWGSFIQDRAGILARDLPGGKNIMWSSDYPHSETTFPNSHAIIRRDFAGVPEADIRDIICNNAKRLLRIS